MTIASNYALRLPSSLKAELERVARDDGTSLNQFIVTAIAKRLAPLRTETFFAECAARADVAKALEVMKRKGGQVPRDDDQL